MSEFDEYPPPSSTGGPAPSANPLQIPAIILIVLSALMLISSPINLVVRMSQMDAIPPGQRGGVLVGSIVGVLLIVIANILIILGAISMLKRKKIGTAKMGAIVACIPVCSPCIIVGIPFGIWALVTMNRPDVQATFES